MLDRLRARVFETLPPPTLIEELDGLLRDAEADPASFADFNALESKVARVAEGNPSPYKHYYEKVAKSKYLRQRGQPSASPRMQLITDSLGRLGGRGKPFIRFDLEQGHKAWFERVPPKGSWDLSIGLTKINDDRSGIQVEISGSRTDHNGELEPFPIDGASSELASKALLDWISARIGHPDSLVPAPTKKELRQLRSIARYGLRSHD